MDGTKNHFRGIALLLLLLVTFPADLEALSFNQCPYSRPDFGSKCSRSQEGLSCDYGRQYCCGEEVPEVTLQCYDHGEWLGFYHDVSCYDCPSQKTPGVCPNSRPDFNSKCSRNQEGLSCNYGRRQCCGKEFHDVTMQCYGQWVGFYNDVVCNC